MRGLLLFILVFGGIPLENHGVIVGLQLCGVMLRQGGPHNHHRAKAGAEPHGPVAHGRRVFFQGSRFVRGGLAVNTPPVRYWAVRLIHAPVISLAARQWFTDTTNAYRAYSRRYLTDPRVQPLRDIFMGYELLAYLSVRATQLGYKACEVPVVRAYPKTGKTPTKIKGMKGNSDLLACLWGALTGKYNP